MKDVSISSQVFSLVIVATMMGSAFFLYNLENENLNYNNYVPVWARSQLDYETNQSYSYVLQQGEYS